VTDEAWIVAEDRRPVSDIQHHGKEEEHGAEPVVLGNSADGNHAADNEQSEQRRQQAERSARIEAFEANRAADGVLLYEERRNEKSAQGEEDVHTEVASGK